MAAEGRQDNLLDRPNAPGEARLRALEAENARLADTIRTLTASEGAAPAAHAVPEAEAEHFRIMADNIPQLAWMADQSGWIFWYNKRWYDYTGTTLEQMEGWGWKSVHHPDHVDRVVEIFSSAVARGEPWEDTFPLRGKDGKFRWFLSRAMPIRDESGNVVRWFGTNTDVTETLSAEAALRETEERRRLATEASGVGSWDLNLATGVLLWDEQCKANFGLPPDAEMSLERFYSLIHPEDLDRVRRAVDDATDDGVMRPYDIEYRVIDAATGQERWIAASGRTLTDDSGRPLRFAGTVLDITDRKDAEHNQHLLINELNHRVKNTLATVQAVAARTLAGAASLPAAREALSSRLVALAKAHDILTAENWEGAEMEEMVRSAIAPYREHQSDRFAVSGPFVRISPLKALALSMALHELATNAMKYGALSSDEGRVAIEWDWYTTPQMRRLRLTWRESGGPQVSPPSGTGFGTRLIQQGLAGQLNARVDMDYRPEGLWCTIDAPLLHVDRKTPR